VAKTRQPKRVDLSKIPADELYAELQQRKSRAQRLVRRYQRLLEQTNKLRAQIEAEGGSVPGGPALMPGIGRVRPVNRMSLADMMQKVLSGKTLSVDEVTKGVLEAGYRTSSSRLRVMVNLTLIKDPRFKRVSRGIYTTAKQ
jgi:hypothetical protein